MGRSRLPDETKILKGTFRKSESNPDAPKPHEGITRSPLANMNEGALKWYDLIQEFLHPGVAHKPDSIALSIFATLMDRFERGEISGTDANRLDKYIVKFGLTPADRTGVSSATKSEKKNAFRELDE